VAAGERGIQFANGFEKRWAEVQSADMNSATARSAQKGLALYEVLVTIAVMAILAVIILLGLSGHPSPAPRAQCINNLKQVGLAYRLWPNGQSDKWPMDVSINHGGTMEFTTGADTFRHFQVMSNELSTPKILVCPADTRAYASDFIRLKNQNVSYFVGLDANDSNPQMLLSGDRNLGGPAKPENGILKLAPGDAVNWTATIHANQGNLGLADGSVQQCSNTGLRAALKNSGDATNVWRIALPE
jgi:prepilin-type N-terminal cleavage/methylation domain-containing protein